jgi:multidrug efflux pump subunit AcrA (membrane-fusion protein)
MIRTIVFSCLALMTGLPLLVSLVNGDDDATMAEPVARKVAAQGRLEPVGGVIKVTAPYVFSAPQVLTQLLVKTGDSITKGQPIATLDSHDRLQAAVDGRDSPPGRLWMAGMDGRDSPPGRLCV